jgi:hypothetical protein
MRIRRSVGECRAATPEFSVAPPPSAEVRLDFGRSKVPHARQPKRRAKRLSRHLIFCLHDKQKKWNRPAARPRGPAAINISGRGDSDMRTRSGVMHAFIPIS